jgi:hypothetical protein
VLDDYSPLREMSAQALAEEAHLFPLRDAYLFNPLGQAPAGAAGLGAMAGNWTAPNPPFGAVFTFNLHHDLPESAKLVMTISDEAGKQVRRFDVAKGAGLRRVAWNLRAEAPAQPEAPGREGRAGQAGAAGRAGGEEQTGRAGGGRGGPPLGPLVAPGRYRAQLGKLSGNDVTPLGQLQTFMVVPLER